MTKDTYDPYATGRILGAAQPSGAAPGSAADAASVDGPDTDSVNGIAVAQLRSLVERIERLAEEKQAIADDIKDVYGEAKANGLDTKALRRIVAMRKQDASERAEQAAILDLYMAALDMLPEPLFEDADDPAGRARRALAEADKKIQRRREREDT